MAHTPQPDLADASTWDRFAVVLFGSPSVCAAVQSLRDRLPPSGRPILPAHVTVKGTFVNPVNLHTTADTLRRICARYAPITLSTSACRTRTDGHLAGAWLEAGPREPIATLHRELFGALADHGETVYRRELEGTYSPHLTLVEEIPAAQADFVLATVAATEHRFTWTAPEAALVGRRGGTDWETLATFPLGG